MLLLHLKQEFFVVISLSIFPNMNFCINAVSRSVYESIIRKKCQKFKMKISFHFYIWGIQSLTDLIVKLEKSGLVFLYCLKMLSFMWQQFSKKGATSRIKWRICNARGVWNEWLEKVEYTKDFQNNYTNSLSY